MMVPDDSCTLRCTLRLLVVIGRDLSLPRLLRAHPTIFDCRRCRFLSLRRLNRRVTSSAFAAGPRRVGAGVRMPGSAFGSVGLTLSSALAGPSRPRPNARMVIQARATNERFGSTVVLCCPAVMH